MNVCMYAYAYTYIHIFNLCGVVSKTVVPPSGVGQCYPSGVARYYANRLQPLQ